MLMKSLFVCCAALAAVIVQADWGPTDFIHGRCDREIPVYGPGERMTFTFDVRGFEGLDKSAHRLVWTRTGDDGRSESGEAPADRPLVLATSLDRPGFVRYYVELRDAADNVVRRENGERKVFFDGGAGVDILKIRQGVPEPADFDAFWSRRKAELAAVAWKDGVKAEKLDSGRDDVELYAVSIPCAGGRPATGFLSVPAAAKAGRKFPARIGFHGYGASWSKGATDQPKPARLAKDWVALDLSAHGFELMRDKAYYDDLRQKAGSNGYDYAFDPAQNADPEKAYFRGMTFRVMRALEYLKSRPEWNGKELLAAGGSMGGLQTIWAAALDPDVTRANPDIPWCCDIGGTEVGRNRGDWYVKWVPALGYYDPVNMARRIPKSCTVRITRAGLGDYICPPTGVMAFYNNLTCPKSVSLLQNSTHGYVPAAPQHVFEIVEERMEAVRFDEGRLLMERYPSKRLDFSDNLYGLLNGNVPDYAVGNVIRWLEIHGRDMSRERARFKPVEPPLGEPLLRRRGFRLGYMLDISRDKVPTMATLKTMVDVLSAAGFNAFQLYTEHTFAYRDHEPAWRGWSPMTAAEIRELDAYAWSKGVVLVPNQNSFGHLEKWFARPEYRYLAAAPDGYAVDHPKVSSDIPRAVNPCDPRTYGFLGGLYAELLPNFAHADEINVGCDEVWDIFDRNARCASRAREIGVPNLYMEHLLKVYDLVKANGRRMAFWAEMVLRYPEQLDKLPKDVNALQWGYGSEWRHPGYSCEFEGRCHALRRRGIPFTVCPSTLTYEESAYALPGARGNIEIAVTSARKYGAEGLLLTEWGDGGHRMPFLASVPAIVSAGLLCKGEPADDASLAAAIDRVVGFRLGEALIRWGTMRVRPKDRPDVAKGRAALESIDLKGAPAWVGHGVRQLLFNQRMLELFLAKGKPTAEDEAEYRKLWLEANRPGGLDDSVRQYLER